MPRRAAYTEVKKYGQVRPAFVRGMGDVAFKGFQCPSLTCKEWLFIRTGALDPVAGYDIACPTCDQEFHSGDVITLYTYDLVDKRDDSVIKSGNFELLIDDYVHEAQQYKFCIVCYKMKPFEMFDRHAPRKTGRQGECNLCKRTYNAIKNETRLTDQHREAAQKRRLYIDLGVTQRVDSKIVRDRFGDKCFKCGKDLTAGGDNIDHTLPAYYLWPVTTDTATLLCSAHNGQKGNSWPSEFYSSPEVRRLSTMTGIDYGLLAGPPTFNPDAIQRLEDPAYVASMILKYAAYMDELIGLRNRILRRTSVDFFWVATDLSQTWIDKANSLV